MKREWPRVPVRRRGIAEDDRQPELTRMCPELSATPRLGKPEPEMVPAGMGVDVETLQRLTCDRLPETVLHPEWLRRPYRARLRRSIARRARPSVARPSC